ncbi:tetrapyrrole biosynthesis porphobilinogen synthase [Phakopsora pachyrhizi]|uniref:Delta-aminolevulinic acid dehydratase n=1 Tax=Phakopsora pachyrhizi TaxID=170000 RepID=A0AAV0B1E1_PHAPC|nr:tetrapyrrole biosynthesis porphobilinogen synthase [Phakopsora pachyrhizi]
MNSLERVLQGGYAHPLTRSLQREKSLTKEMLMYPIITDQPDSIEPIDSLPSQNRLGISRLEEFLKPLVEKGLCSVMLFGVPLEAKKDRRGTPADDPEGPVILAIRLITEKFPKLFVAADVCLCEYTDHGHCGIFRLRLTIGSYEASVERITEIALSYARAGAHCVAPSDMMDGRVGSIKAALIENGFGNKCCLMAYSAKFATVLYGPFRTAAGSAPSKGDRRGYQIPSTSRGLAKRAILRDISEGADIVMVKPAQTYLDIVSEARRLAPDHPIACYQVSGEYSMIIAGAEAGVYGLKEMVLESINSMLRAGACLILSYFTPSVLEWI